MRLVTSRPVSRTTTKAKISPSPGSRNPSSACGWYRSGSRTRVRSISDTKKLMTQMVAMIGSQTNVPATSNRRRLGRLEPFTTRGSSATALAGLGFGFGGALARRRLGGRLGGFRGRAFAGGAARAAGFACRRLVGGRFGLRFAFGRLGFRCRRGLARLGIRAFAAVTGQIALGFLVGLEVRLVP